jgi:toxin ParE1/3/4
VKRVTFLTIAEIEMSAAATYYEKQKQGLGKQFLDSVSHAIDRVRKSPEMFRYFAKPVRSCRLGPFPYRLLYRELDDRIQIVAIFHFKQST